MHQAFNERIVELETNIWSAALGLLIIFLILTMIIYFMDRLGVVALIIGPENQNTVLRRSLVRATKITELIAVLFAVIVVVVEFQVEKPREREVRIAQLLTQLIGLTNLGAERLPTASPAIVTVLNLLDEDIRLRGINLPGVNLVGINLSNRDLAGANLRRTELANADLNNAVLNQANFSGANLSGADLSKVRARSADFVDATLEHTDLKGAYLADAKFKNASLMGAALDHVVLIDADLAGANLCGANFHRADLIKADLTDTILLGAELSRANLTNAKGLTQAQIDQAFQSPSDSPPGTLPDGLTWNEDEARQRWREFHQPLQARGIEGDDGRLHLHRLSWAKLQSKCEKSLGSRISDSGRN